MEMRDALASSTERDGYELDNFGRWKNHRRETTEERIFPYSYIAVEK